MYKNNLYRMMDLQSKVGALSEQNGLKLIFQWVKQEHINFNEFHELILGVNYDLEEDFDLSE